MRGFRLSSGRRKVGRNRSTASVVVPAIVVSLLLGYLAAQVDCSSPPPAPTRQAVVLRPTPARPTAVPPTATPGLVYFSAEFDIPTPTTTPTATWSPPRQATRRPRLPSPTPSVAHCVSVTWQVDGHRPTAGGVTPITVTAANRCRRDLGQLDVWFRISGWRDGAIAHTVSGHPFETLYDGHSVSVTIGLPGVADWYDRITLDVLDRAP